MKVFTNLLFKVTLSSMVLTAPAMIPGSTIAGGSLPDKEAALPFYSSAVIRNYIDHLTMVPVRAYPQGAAAIPEVNLAAKLATSPGISREAEGLRSAEGLKSVEGKKSAEGLKSVEGKKSAEGLNAVARMKSAEGLKSIEGKKSAAGLPLGEESEFRLLVAAAAKAAETRRVIDESAVIYRHMDLEKTGLSEMAFEYAWRGYHNLLKKGSIRRSGVLSICDFSQSSRAKRMYVIDVHHEKLLYRTYVAHGQRSGDEFAQSFSNEPESFKSSLGFYVTQTTYYGHNGLSLRLNGVDSGYNDMALKRKIVLHGSSYVSDKYMQNFGTLGTSLGCPALPAAVSSVIIRKVKGGSCFFIYQPTQEYLDHSAVLTE